MSGEGVRRGVLVISLTMAMGAVVGVTVGYFLQERSVLLASGGVWLASFLTFASAAGGSRNGMPRRRIRFDPLRAVVWVAYNIWH